MKYRIPFILLAIVIAVTIISQLGAALAADPGAGEPLMRPQPDERLLALAEEQGQLAVIVGFHTPGYSVEAMAAGEQAAEAQEAAIAIQREGLLERLAGHEINAVKAYDFIPYVAMHVDAAALQALYEDSQVTAVEEDFVVETLLGDSVPLVRAHFAHLILYRGQGQAMAILDTGVDKFHPDLAGKVVSEACYSTTNSATGFSSLCPGGASSSIATNSGLNCSTTINGCYHGTHVAGTALGVAPDARIIAIQVFSRASTSCTPADRNPCTLSTVSDIVAALNRVYALRNTFTIASVNMSLGSGQYSSGCDNVSTATFNVVNLLRGVGISTVASAGNSGYKNSMGWPACHTNIISVGSTTKSDQVADYSNISAFTTLLAPGSDIYAPMPPAYGYSYASLSGTSMAAPHVAGAIALLKNARSNLTVPEISSHLVNGGVLVSDQRPGGTITKRRLDVWGSICRIITCDADDFRTILAGQTFNGTISPSTDVDHYYYNGQAGERLTLRMNRTSGNVDPFLELYTPSGIRVAFNDNGGGGVNALINGYTLQQTGTYRIRASSVGSTTGGYQLIASREVVPLNPVPRIDRLSPPSATGTFFGSDFWVAIYGQNFMPESEVRWNGQLRAKFYSHSGLIYIRVLGGDIGFPWPRLAFVTVQNPTPGGGTSNSMPFTISDPFLGESELIAPESGSSVATGVDTTFVISWTHPTDSWRTMQNMDIRLRNDVGETAMWLRMTEGNPTSTLSLLNSSGTPVISTTLVSGQSGQGPDLELPDQVTLRTNQTIFFGSGQTIIISPTVSFGPLAVGTYNIEFEVDNEEGEVQADDVLGTFIIHPPGCPVSLASVSVNGPAAGAVNTTYTYSAAVTPANATTPITYDWAPEPESGQGTATAVYRWSTAGEKTIFLGVENCGTFVADVRSVQVSTTTAPDLGISKEAPATALAGEIITYTLAISNSGATTANNLAVVDTLPAGATYVGGGTRVGNEVRWTIPSLAGYGATAEVSYAITAAADVTNTNYSVTAAGGYGASGSRQVVTKIVDARVEVTPVTTGTLTYAGKTITFPGGSVFEDTTFAYKELTPAYAAPPGGRFAGHAFRLDAYQGNQLAPGLQLGEAMTVVINYSNADVAGLDENLLTLLYWNGSHWSGNGITCQRNPAANRVTCTAMTPVSTQFALFEQLHHLYLPLVTNMPANPYAQITGITGSGSQYTVAFQTYNFQPSLHGQHVHFFFNTVPPGQAGAPGSGPWYVYAGPTPFTGYGAADRPASASQLCILVANHDHSVQANSGNCYNLP